MLKATTLVLVDELSGALIAIIVGANFRSWRRRQGVRHQQDTWWTHPLHPSITRSHHILIPELTGIRTAIRQAPPPYPTYPGAVPPPPQGAPQALAMSGNLLVLFRVPPRDQWCFHGGLRDQLRGGPAYGTR